MSTTYTVDDFDRQTERLQQGRTATKEHRQRVLALSRKHVQARLKAILDEPAEISIMVDGREQKHTMPALEAMTHKLVEMVLGKGDFQSVKDKDRIAAYKAVHDRVYGAPKQTIEHTQADTAEDETAELSTDKLKELERAMENALLPDVKAL